MNRLKKFGTALAVAGLLASYVPTGTVLAQVDPNAPIEVSVDILLQVDANQPKRQENATYEIVDEAGNVVYRHESDAQTTEAPQLKAGKYRLRLYDGQGFKRADKEIKAQKVETSIPKRSDQDIAANKQLQEQADKGSLKTNDQGQTYYEVPFEVQAGPDLETPDHQKMVTKLAVTLSDQEAAPSNQPQQESSQQQSQAPAPAAKGSALVKVIDDQGQPVVGAELDFNDQTYTTDANGQFEVSDLDPGQYGLELDQLPDGYVGEYKGVADVQANTRKEITLTVAKETKQAVVFNVVDEQGNPVKDVTVTFNGETEDTDQAGKAVFQDVAPGEYDYQITSLPDNYQGQANGRAAVIAGQESNINLTVQSKPQAPATHRLTIKVVDEAGQPVAGAKLEAAGQVGATNEAGEAVFEGVAGGNYQYALTQEAEGYTGTPTGNFDMPADKDHVLTLQVTKDVPAKRNLTVRVLDQEQKVVPGATVTVQDQTATTDENGDAVFKDLTPGTIHYAVTQVPAGYEGTPSGDAELPADTDHSVTLQVTKQAVKRNLTVRVLDQDQKEVPGVTVTVQDQTATTDENGTAQFKDLTPGTIHYAVTQVPAGYEGTPSGDAELPTDTDHSITLQVAKQAESSSQPQTVDVTVKVQDNEGQAVAGAELKLGDQVVTTDANGQAVFKGLTAGQSVAYAITKLPEGYEGTQTGTLDPAQGLTLSVTKKAPEVAKRDLTVKVLDNSGKEVPGVSVKVGDQVQVTDENGQTVFKGLTPGTFHYEIVNLPENFTGTQVGDAELPADTDHSITLQVTRQQALAKVTAKVMDENNQAVAGVTVYLGGLEGQTDEQGNITFDELEAGKYTYGIKAVPDGYQAETGEQTQDIAPGADLHPVLKVRHKAQVASLELQVVNVAGQPVADVTLAVGNQQLKTDAQGKVTFGDLKAGDYEYQVVAVPEPYQLDQTKIKLTLASGQTAQRTIQLVEKAAAASSSSVSSETVTATKTSGVERKDGNLPSTGEQVMGWLTPLAVALVALGGAILFYRRRKAGPTNPESSNEDDSNE